MAISFLAIKKLVNLINKDCKNFTLDVIEVNGSYSVVVDCGSSDLSSYLESHGLTSVECFWYLYGIYVYLSFGKCKDD